jgi:hypothetical protein
MPKNNSFEDEFAETYISKKEPPPDIVVFNELRSCADLFRLHQKNQLNIQPFFQRENVWAATEQTRFIDSLVKQLPIPSMCFALDYDTRKWIVIDGLQRMTAIIKFLNPDNDWTLSKLLDIDPKIAGASTKELHDEQSNLHPYIERVENLSLPITVLRCNLSNSDHMEYLFKIFHRLNSGGMKLNNQEVRNCIYSGRLNDCLIELDKSSEWRKLHKNINGKKDRFRSVELILRIYAFSESISKYSGNLTVFLNAFMHQHRNASEQKLHSFKEKLERTCHLLVDKIIPNMTTQKFGFTQIEALAVGVIENLDNVETLNLGALKKCIQSFEEIELLQGKALSEGISKVEKVKGRLQSAIKAFS